MQLVLWKQCYKVYFFGDIFISFGLRTNDIVQGDHINELLIYEIKCDNFDFI